MSQKTSAEHVFAAGETLRGVAQQYGLSLQDLCDANRISPTTIIAPGRRLIIPETPVVVAAVPQEYIVQPGDTLWGIAQKLKIPMERLIEYNRLNDPTRLRVGQKLLLTAPVPEPEGKPAGRPILRKGDKGEAVKELQTLLREQGFAVEVDGVFGRETEKAVKDFQAKHGLVTDGVVGAQTWEALAAGGQASPLLLSGKKVCVDPGHGLPDPGAVSPQGLTEQEVALSIGLNTVKLLQDLGAKVWITRSAERRLVERLRWAGADLQARVDIANDAKADIFVSIHCNGGSATASGIETYYHGPFRRQGYVLADAIHNSVMQAFPDHKNRGVRADTEIYASGFHVLRETSMPAVLLETEFITNPSMDKFLRDRKVQYLYAVAIADGIKRFFS